MFRTGKVKSQTPQATKEPKSKKSRKNKRKRVQEKLARKESQRENDNIYRIENVEDDWERKKASTSSTVNWEKKKKEAIKQHLKSVEGKKEYIRKEYEKYKEFFNYFLLGNNVYQSLNVDQFEAKIDKLKNVLKEEPPKLNYWINNVSKDRKNTIAFQQGQQGFMKKLPLIVTMEEYRPRILKVMNRFIKEDWATICKEIENQQSNDLSGILVINLDIYANSCFFEESAQYLFDEESLLENLLYIIRNMNKLKVNDNLRNHLNIMRIIYYVIRATNIKDSIVANEWLPALFKLLCTCDKENTMLPTIKEIEHHNGPPVLGKFGILYYLMMTIVHFIDTKSFFKQLELVENQQILLSLTAINQPHLNPMLSTLWSVISIESPSLLEKYMVGASEPKLKQVIEEQMNNLCTYLDEEELYLNHPMYMVIPEVEEKTMVIQKSTKPMSLSYSSRGGKCHKPVIYMYDHQSASRKQTLQNEVKVHLSKFHKFTTVIPSFPWRDILIQNDSGDLLIQQTSYPYLYWESQMNLEGLLRFKSYIKSVQFTHQKHEFLEPFLHQRMAELGLIEKERQDFVEFWLQKMPSTHDYAIYFLTESEIHDWIASLSFAPIPTFIKRVFMIFKKHPLGSLISQNINETTVRKDKCILKPRLDQLCAIEWGGMELR